MTNNCEIFLGWLDYRARFYDPQIGRFHTLDRFSEKYTNQSPYHYGLSNPVKFVDVNGDSAWQIKNKWTENYTKKYRSTLNSKISNLEKEGKDFTCDDLAIEIAMEFAKENNLPFIWQTEDKNFDASSNEYNDFDSFSNEVKSYTAAREFINPKNISNIDIGSLQTGDLAVLTESGKPAPNHVQVISGLNFDEGVIKGYNAAQGNFNALGRLLGSSNPQHINYLGVPVQRGYYSRELDSWNNQTQGKTTYNFSKNQYHVEFRKINFNQMNK